MLPVRPVGFYFAVQPDQVADSLLLHFFLDDRVLHELLEATEVLGCGPGLEPGIQCVDELLLRNDLKICILQFIAQAVDEAAVGLVVPGVASAQNRHLFTRPDFDRLGGGPIIVDRGGGCASTDRRGRGK